LKAFFILHFESSEKGINFGFRKGLFFSRFRKKEAEGEIFFNQVPEFLKNCL